MQGAELDGQLIWILREQCLSYTASGDRIRRGIVGGGEIDAVAFCRSGERALAFAVTIDEFIDHQRIDDRARRLKRGDSMTQCLTIEQSEIVGCVVDRDRNAAPQ